MICARDHSGDLPNTFNTLPESQSGTGHHKCAACAFELGRRECESVEGRLRERIRKLEAELAEVKAAIDLLKPKG